jgi:hypothetical protein
VNFLWFETREYRRDFQAYAEPRQRFKVLDFSFKWRKENLEKENVLPCI